MIRFRTPSGIISFNDRPLRVCIQFGFICLGLALLYLVFELMKYIFAAGNYVSGYFTTIAAIILFSGVQLIFIGILGEYIGKSFGKNIQRKFSMLQVPCSQ